MRLRLGRDDSCLENFQNAEENSSAFFATIRSIHARNA